MFRDEIMVFKRYFEQRFLDGLPRKAQAYHPCSIDLIKMKNLRALQFFKNFPLCCYGLRFLSPVSPARARDMRSHFSGSTPASLSSKGQENKLGYSARRRKTTDLKKKRLDRSTYCSHSNKIEASAAILLGPLSR